jgi:ABC-type multidrug transport system fused ATPase/permease subunit
MNPSLDADGAIKPKAPLLRVREDVADDGGINSGNDELTTAETATASPRSQLLRKSRSRYMSMYNKESKWSAKRSRHLYMNDLLLQRQQAINNIFLGEDQDEEEGVGGGVGDSARKISNKMHAAFVHNLKTFVDKDTSVLPSVEIRVKNFSFDVPLSEGEAEGKIKIPTVFNYSPIYWCKKAGEKVMKGGKIESATERKEVKHVLKNVNLALEPGKMYLIIGPPSSGKTSLLNGE